MKILTSISIILLFFLYSCNSSKKYKAIEAYLISDVINPKYKYLLIEDKIKKENTLRIIYGHDSINENYYEFTPINSQRSKFINNNDWNTIYEDNIKDSFEEKWKKENFKNVNLELQPSIGLYNTKFLNQYANNERRIIWLSNPIYYKEKKNLMFYFSESSTFKNVTKIPKVIFMKKSKRKWEVIDKVDHYKFY